MTLTKAEARLVIEEAGFNGGYWGVIEEGRVLL